MRVGTRSIGTTVEKKKETRANLVINAGFEVEKIFIEVVMGNVRNSFKS